MFYTYVLESVKSGKLYVGYATDLKHRLSEHNRGLNFSTKPFLPLEEDDAKRRERYLKTTQGSRLLKRRLKEYFYSKKLIRNSTTGDEH